MANDNPTFLALTDQNGDEHHFQTIDIVADGMEPWMEKPEPIQLCGTFQTRPILEELVGQPFFFNGRRIGVVDRIDSERGVAVVTPEPKAVRRSLRIQAWRRGWVMATHPSHKSRGMRRHIRRSKAAGEWRANG